MQQRLLVLLVALAASVISHPAGGKHILEESSSSVSGSTPTAHSPGMVQKRANANERTPSPNPDDESKKTPSLTFAERREALRPIIESAADDRSEAARLVGNLNDAAEKYSKGDMAGFIDGMEIMGHMGNWKSPTKKEIMDQAAALLRELGHPFGGTFQV